MDGDFELKKGTDLTIGPAQAAPSHLFGEIHFNARYRNELECKWTARAPEGSMIRIDFTEWFSVEGYCPKISDPKNDKYSKRIRSWDHHMFQCPWIPCTRDSVEVFDGATLEKENRLAQVGILNLFFYFLTFNATCMQHWATLRRIFGLLLLVYRQRNKPWDTRTVCGTL